MAIDETVSYRIDLNVALMIWNNACGQGSAPFALVPGHAIERYDSSHERPLERILLPDWTAFEEDRVQWDHHDFARLLGLANITPSLPLVLVTDEGLRDRCAFRFINSDFPGFVSWYEGTYRMDFFQSADYLIFDERLDFLRILHHEGALFRNPRSFDPHRG